MAQSRSDTSGDASIVAKLASTVPTLGEKLAIEARHVANRHMPAFPWLRLLALTSERVLSLPVPSQKRFQRKEALPVPTLPLFSPPHQLFVPPDPDMPEHAIEGDSQVWDQPLSSAVQQQSSLRIDVQTNHMRILEGGTNPPPRSEMSGDIQQQEWGQPLPPLVQQRLRDFVGPGTETIRTHSDAVADTIARSQRADAVTVGHHVFFRKDQFQPQERKGFALLTHEATHVMQAMRPDSAWKRATQGGVHEEEQEARAQERKALGTEPGSSFFRQPATLSTRPVLVPRNSLQSDRLQGASGPVIPSAPVQRPMTAAIDRPVDQEAAPASPMPDVEELKRTLLRELMKQLKTNQERGA
jgi:hypothetical protein